MAAQKFEKKVTQEEREAAAARLQEKAAEAASAPGPQAAEPVIGQGDIPDYFSMTVPYWNYTQPLAKFVDTLPGLGATRGGRVRLDSFIGFIGDDPLVMQLFVPSVV